MSSKRQIWCRRNIIGKIFLPVVVLFLFILPAMYSAGSVYAFDGCQEDCKKCHTINDNEVKVIFEKMKVPDAKIKKIQMSPVKGLWEVAIENKGQFGLLYVDFSKKYVVAGSIVEVNAAINKTQQRLDELKMIKPASISLKDALVLGSNAAAKKVIVFTDPD